MLVYLISKCLECWPAVLAVELDAEVLVLTPRVVTRGQQDTPEAVVVAVGAVQKTDQGRGCRGRDQTVQADVEVRDTVGSRKVEDDLDCDVVVEATVASDNECVALVV